MNRYDTWAVKEAMDKAFEDGMEELESLVEIMAPGGVAYDQQALTRDQDVIAFYLDLQNRPSPEFSILTFLADIAPKVHAEIVSDYERAMRKQIGAASG